MNHSSCGVLSVAVLLVAFVTVASVRTKPASALDRKRPPSANFDLTHWKLTLPTGKEGSPDEILPAQLSYGYTHTAYFSSARADGAMRFWAPVTGVTTGGSSYPRTELREQLNAGQNAPNWYADGTHVLDAECRIVQVPSSGRVIIGQVHGKAAPGGENANPLVKLAYDREKSSLRIQVKTSPHRDDTSESTDLVKGVKLGSLIRYQIKIVDGVVHVTVNGTTYSRDFYATDSDWSQTDLYFKAGAYCIDNKGPSSEGAEVHFYHLKVSHQPATKRSFDRAPTWVPKVSPTLGAAFFGSGDAPRDAPRAWTKAPSREAVTKPERTTPCALKNPWFCPLASPRAYTSAGPRCDSRANIEAVEQVLPSTQTTVCSVVP